MDIKLSKAQLTKIIQSDGFLDKMIGNTIANVGRKALLDFSVSFAKNILRQFC